MKRREEKDKRMGGGGEREWKERGRERRWCASTHHAEE